MEGRNRFLRLFELMTEIRGNPRQTPEQIARYFGISKTQFYKDKAELEKLNFQFKYNRLTRSFEIEKDPFIPTGHLTLTEISALIMSVRQLFDMSDYIITYRAIKAIKKIVANYPDTLVRHKLERVLEDAIYNEGYGCKETILNALEYAMEHRKIVKIIYISPYDDFQKITHDIDVYMIFFRRRSLYMDAYCRTTGDIRTYRLSRVLKIEPWPEPNRFEVREDYSFRNRHRDSFSVFTGERKTRVKIRFNKEKAFYIQEVKWHPSERIEALKDGGILYEVEVAEPREVIWWVRQWGPDAEVLEPEEMRQYMLNMARREVEMYGQNPEDGDKNLR
ncbi:MAG TPA: WYL domain-containing protein [Candidatus Limnocylindrales bacterium]|nr:WYL domain-containing protein [Candidatus Limnocylindrales bacterium]